MKILNFGSLNLDYVYSVGHFVKPGETLSASQQTVNPGGKGLNQSVALARAGADVYHAGVLGNGGAMLKDVLEANGVHTDFLETQDIVQGNAVIQVNPDGENCIILFGGSNQCITDEQVDETVAHFDADDWLILQNEINANARIVDKAHERGMKIVLNPSPYDARLDDVDFGKLTWLMVNEVEAEQMTGCSEPDEAWKVIHEKWPHLSCVFTLGKDGCVAFRVDEAEETERHADAFKAAGVVCFENADVTDKASSAYKACGAAGVREADCTGRPEDVDKTADTVCLAKAASAEKITDAFKTCGAGRFENADGTGRPEAAVKACGAVCSEKADRTGRPVAASKTAGAADKASSADKACGADGVCEADCTGSPEAAVKACGAVCSEKAERTGRHADAFETAGVDRFEKAGTADKASSAVKACGTVEKQEQAAFSVQAVDTTAAGDTFTGYFVAELMQGAALSRALLTATTAAAISVTRPGAAASVPTRGEVTATGEVRLLQISE